jgi:hypothetical protein
MIPSHFFAQTKVSSENIFLNDLACWIVEYRTLHIKTLDIRVVVHTCNPHTWEAKAGDGLL